MNKPFLLRPSGKDYIWGGQRLNEEFEKNIDVQSLAETWECSTHPDGPSYVVNGDFEGMKLADVIKSHPDFLGERYQGLSELPILIKLIDAKSNLSIQVHPDDEYAKKNEHGQNGKNEMWYVLDASKDAKLVYGFNRDVDKETVKRSIGEGSLLKHLQVVDVKKDDVFYIETGMVHALGAGSLVAEIQENSNITYRLYDYNRVDKNGKSRDLHIDKALDVANLKSSAKPKQHLRVLKYSKGIASELLCRCRHFEVFRMLVNTDRRQEVTYQADEISFRVLLCVSGCGIINNENENFQFFKGDCIFVPAKSTKMTIFGQASFLDIRG